MGDRGFIKEAITQAIKVISKNLELESWFSQDLVGKDKRDSSSTCSINAEGSKIEKCEKIIERVKTCTLCKLHESRTNVVFGEGSLDSDLVFIGEAPGRDEDRSGRPFVGAAGQLLTKIIQAMGMSRRDVYITNILRCRPPANRNPLPEEIIQCRPYLSELLTVIKPKVICTLGKIAAWSLLDEKIPISRLRGKFYEYNGIPVMPTYHPAYLLRNPADKKLVWQDVKKIIAFLKE
ncbi:MAG: uracil-DNA glycosylase [PVC group bacterium]|nr:uracil-DNA glycosylase [PVC group bacterium]